MQLNATANWGSTGKIAEQIGIKAIEQGWESYIAYGRNMNPSENKLIKIGNKINVYEHYLENKLLDNEGLASRIVTKNFIKEIEKIKPNLIHLHNIHDHWLNYRILFSYLKTLQIPVVWTQHDCWAFTGHCAHFDSIKCNKWKTGCYNCPLKSHYSLDHSRRNYELKKELFNSLKSLTIVPVSNWLSKLVKESHLKGNSIRTISNAVDLSVFKPQESNIKEEYGLADKKILLAVSSVWPNYKGLKDYIHLSNYLTEDFQIVLVGLSKEQINKLPPNILGLERTNNVQDLVKLYSAADIVLNFSYLETFGLTTVEGFACGTPSIVYNKTASPELISPETGVVVEAGDYESIIQAIEQICTKGKTYYSSQCIERAKKMYNIKDRFQDYINLYNELIIK